MIRPSSFNSFSKAQRIKSFRELRFVLSEGQRMAQAEFILSRVHTDGPVSRLGIILRKKYMKSAIVRNRFKRIVRECFRTACTVQGKSNNPQEGSSPLALSSKYDDIVITVSEKPNDVSRQYFREQISLLLSELSNKTA